MSAARYAIEVTEAQAHAIADALDFYVRVVGLAQLDEVAAAHRMHMDLRDDAQRQTSEGLDALMGAAKVCAFGLRHGASRGIHSQDVPAVCLTMYDLRRVLRRALTGRRIAELEAEGDADGAAWLRGTVDMDRRAPVGEGPVAVVTLGQEREGSDPTA